MYFMSKTPPFYSEGATSALLLLGWFASELVFVLSMVCFLTQRKGIESHFQQYIAKRRQLWGSKDLLDWDRVGINDALKMNSGRLGIARLSSAFGGRLRICFF